MNPGEKQRQDQKLGLSMTLIGGLLLTIDAPLLRLAQTDSWTIILERAKDRGAVTAAK